MSLDATPTRILRAGRVTWDAAQGIYVEGFRGENTTCRDTIALALTHAIRELAEELRNVIERPGGGTSVIGAAPLSAEQRFDVQREQDNIRRKTSYV